MLTRFRVSECVVRNAASRGAARRRTLVRRAGLRGAAGGVLALLLALAGCKSATTPAINPTVIDTYPAWSPDGRTIAFTRSVKEVWTVDVASGSVTKLADGVLPAWSPDGTRLSYLNRGRLYTRTMATGDTSSVLINGRYPTHDAAWSRVAFGRGSNVLGDTLNGIWLIGDTIATPRQVFRADDATLADINMLAWSPADSTIAFMSHVIEGAEEIYLFHLRDSSLVLLTSGALLNRDPAWSPDGRSIAWARASAGDTNPASGIWVMDQDGLHQRHVVSGGVKETTALSPAWSPTGQQIVYSGYNDDSDTFTLWVVNADGTAKHQVTRP